MSGWKKPMTMMPCKAKMEPKDFILASASAQRKELLTRIGLIPKEIVSADIDESALPCEKPSAYVRRMALEKALKVAESHPGEVILACDTIVAVGRRLLHKAQNEEEQTRVMNLLSGRTHKVLSAVCVLNRSGRASIRLVSTRILMKKLSPAEIASYVASREWVGCSGYKIEGRMEAFVRKMIGSYSGVIGLPLYETGNLLNGVGIK